MDLEIGFKKNKEGVLTISLTGSLDSDTHAECDKKIQDALADKNIKALVFDLQGLDYISSIGFSLIFKTKKAMEQKGCAFAITNVQPNIKKIFDAVKVIPFENMDEVDEYLDKYIDSMSRRGKKENPDDNSRK